MAGMGTEPGRSIIGHRTYVRGYQDFLGTIVGCRGPEAAIVEWDNPTFSTSRELVSGLVILDDVEMFDYEPDSGIV